MSVRSRLRAALISVCAAGAVALVAWAGLAPIESDVREEVFEIPNGTWARRMSGENVGVLPDEINLTLGVRDVLVLRNLDDVPQIFGPALMMPGQSFKLPFEQASENQFMCTAHASGQMTVIVHPNPATPWARIIWRVREAMRRR